MLSGAIPRQGCQHGLELRAQDSGVALHELEHMGLVLQEADMTQLVNLVIADGLRTEQTGEVFQVRLGTPP